MNIVEVGFKLDESFEYYDKLLRKNGMINDFFSVTRDIYYTNKKLDGLSELEMKKSCIRLRSCNNSDFVIENNLLDVFNQKSINIIELESYEKIINEYNFFKIFDTLKHDYHYVKDGMNSKIQIQNIDNIGLVIYFDNSKYYHLDESMQRKMLIDELNSYGFDFTYEDLGIDKLRTLYYGKEMFSHNQNS